MPCMYSETDSAHAKDNGGGCDFEKNKFEFPALTYIFSLFVFCYMSSLCAKLSNSFSAILNPGQI